MQLDGISKISFYVFFPFPSNLDIRSDVKMIFTRDKWCWLALISRIWVARFEESCFSCKKKKKKLDKPDLGKKKKKKKEDSIDECNDDITLEKKKRRGNGRKGRESFTVSI